MSEIKWYTPAETMEKLSVSKSTLTQLVKRGSLLAFKLNDREKGTWRYDVDGFLEKRLKDALERIEKAKKENKSL